MAKSIATSSYRIGLSADPANNFDLEPDGAGSLLIKRVSDGLVQAKIDANGNLLGKVPAFRAIQNAALGLDTDWRIVPFQSTDFAYGMTITNGGKTVTPKTPGLYLFEWTVQGDGNPVVLFAAITRNSATYKYASRSGNSAGFQVVTGTALMHCNGTDFVEISANATGASATSGGVGCQFSGHLVSADL